jgi:ribonuclease E
MNHILINATHKEEIRVAIVRSQKLTDLNIETSLNRKTKGNIYKARISRVEQSLEAAFVDYGKEKHGFLPFKEVSDFFASGIKPKGDKLTISDVLKEGQEIIIQVEKEERSNKGAALSTYINLAGAYMILTPNNPKSAGISRQINTTDRQELKKLLPKLQVPKHSGLIIRTEGAGKSLEELQWEVDHLTQLWKSIKTATKNQDEPFLIYQESDITVRAIRDYLREDTDSVIIDDLETYQKARDFVGFVMPHYLDRLKYFDITEHSLFAHMSVESQVKSVFNREVTLKSGASIVFDATEALTAIDINSARATRGTSIEDTALKANLEAAEEIAIQLQLRDIGGLIVIDFIDMASEENRMAIEKAMEKATANDRARVQIGTISKFGLLELSRQRLMSSVAESTGKICSQCNGSGTTPTIPTLALKIVRQLEDLLNSRTINTDITIQSSIEVVTYLLNEKRKNINELEFKYGISITLLPNQYMHFPNFSINKQKGDKKSNHKSFQGISKPQINPNEINFFEKPEKPVILSNHPLTRMPIRKTSFMSKLSDMFSIEKPETPKQKSDRPQNKNQNRNRNRNQKAGEKNKNTGNQKQSGSKKVSQNQNRNRNQKTTSNDNKKSTEKISEKKTEKVT